MSVIEVTKSAQEYIAARCKENEVLAVSVTSKGCSGHSYSYELIDINTVSKFDELIQWDVGGIVVKADSIMKLIGSTLDIKVSILEEILIWNNPMAINLCGCGESFSLK